MKIPTFSLPLLFAGLLTSQAATTDSASLTGLREYVSGGDVTALRRYEQLVIQAVADPAVRELVEADLARVLAGPSSFEAKRFACTQLAVVGGEASVPALATLLKDDETTGIACLALATNPSPKAGQALRNSLSRLQGGALVQVVNTIGTRRDTAAVRQLRQLTGHEDRQVAGAAYLALGKVGTPGAQTALAEARQAADASVLSDVAAGSLLIAEQRLAANRRPAATRIYDELLAAAWPHHVRRGAFEALVRLDRDGGLARVTAALEGSESLFKPSAIAAVATMKNPSASQTVGALIPTLEPAEQALLVESLAWRNDPAARGVVEAQLESPHELVSTVAIQSLGRIGDASTVPALGRAVLSARNESQLRTIELALANLAGGNAVDQALTAQLRNRMAGPKAPFLGAIVRRANPDSLHVFLAEAGSADSVMARLAFQGLGRVARADDLPAVLKALADLRAPVALDDAQASLGQVLRRAASPTQASAAVRDALTAATGASGQMKFLPLLVFCPDAAGLARVVAAAQDTDAEIRDLGLRTLADWPEVSAWEPLLAQYAQAPSAAERIVALRGLARLLGEQNAQPTPELIARYRSLLSDARNDSDRKLILGALAGCPDLGALALALEQLAQPGVQAEAKLAVSKIAEAIKARHPEAAAAALKKLEGR